jgi:hypothetical protein
MNSNTVTCSENWACTSGLISSVVKVEINLEYQDTWEWPTSVSLVLVVMRNEHYMLVADDFSLIMVSISMVDAT